MSFRNSYRKVWGFESLLGYHKINPTNMIRRNFLYIWLLALIALAIVVILQEIPDKPFKKAQYSDNNYVVNYTGYPYMDTIVYVGLDSLGMCDVTVEVKTLSQDAKNNFPDNIELRGLLFGSGREYTMWVEKSDRKGHIRIVAHELIHLRQYHSKQLIYDGFYVYWARAKYDLKEIEYFSRPWEADAFEHEVKLDRQIRSVLY